LNRQFLQGHGRAAFFPPGKQSPRVAGGDDCAISGCSAICTFDTWATTKRQTADHFELS
jgi:hypothetical protein